MPHAAEIEAELRAHCLPGIGDLLPCDEFVMPHYEGLGIANLPATIATLLGGELPGACPPLRHDLWAEWASGVRRVVLVLFDALGYFQLRAAMQADDELIFHRLVEGGTLLPITSATPSTTCTVLTTLWTGYSPAAHGILAFEVLLRELSVAASLLFFYPIHHRQRDALSDWGVKADTFVPVPGLGEQLAAQGITTYSMIHKAYAHSMLSRICHRGVQGVVSFVGAGDMWLGLQRIIERHLDEKLYIMAYWGTMDGITHDYSPDDESWDVELRGISWMMEKGFLSRLTPKQREGTLLLLVADHGGISTSPKTAVQFDDHPSLRDALSLPPLGEGRMPFLHTHADTFERARSYMQDQLSPSFVTLTREQVLSSGLLGPGPMYLETPHRLGDLVGLARGSHYLTRNDRQLKMKGRHGGLLAQEMWIPLFGVRLDAL